jgi:hypothetical protein
MVEEANRGKLMVAEADRDKLGRRESGVRPWREGERSQVVAAEVKRGELVVERERSKAMAAEAKQSKLMLRD